MGDEDGGDAEFLLDGPDLVAQADPDLGVERREWFVQKKHPRFDGQRPGQGHPLLLPSRHLVREVAFLAGQADEVEHLLGPATNLLGGLLANPQTERDVVESRHIRKQAVVLEHHAHVAAVGRHRVDRSAVDENRTAVGELESGDDP